MRIARHVVTHDTGLAPNPFHGLCTSALCTPSHMNARLRPGEWLVGNSDKEDGYRLVYAMRVDERLSLDEYFKRYPAKRPKLDGTATEQCGDAMYYVDDNRVWRRVPSPWHNEPGAMAQDTGKGRGHPVFVSRHFYYFGRARPVLDDEFGEVLKRGIGLTYIEGAPADRFVSWLQRNFKPGIVGMPRDMDDDAGCGTTEDCGRPKKSSASECSGNFAARPRRREVRKGSC